jgi:hypothetical protein
MNRYQIDLLRERLEYASCVGKKVYLSQREADGKVALSSFHSGEELVGYQCPFCLLFHIGHRKSKKRIAGEGMARRYEVQKRKTA